MQRVLAEMETAGIAVDLDAAVRAAERVRRPDPRRRRGGVRGDRQADQPRLAQAAAGGAVRRAGDAEDQAHQDRLHHRRGRAAVAVRQDRASVPAASAGPPRRHPAEGHRRRAAELGGLRRPDPHHVQPDDRRDRPAVVDRAEPAEHPDPHRRRPPDPRRVRRRQGLRRADDGRLQPDRDADHGAPVPRRGPDRGVQHRRGPALVRRVAGVRRADRRGHRRAAAPGQGDVLRAGVRAVAPTAWPRS